LFDRSHSATRCVSCRTALANAPPERCPRCGADNRAWYAWTQAGLKEHLNRFFLRSPWGWLALLSLLLPLVSWGVFDFERTAFETSVLSASLLLSLAGLILLFLRRDVLWVYELASRVSPRFRVGLLPLGGAGFLTFAVIAGMLGTAWGLAFLRAERSEFMQPMSWEVLVAMGLAFTGQALAAGLYGVYAYGRWLSDTFPAPIFLDEGHLLRLVERSARPRIQVKSERYEYEAVMTRVVALSRTDQAGLSLKIRAEVATEEVFEGHFLKAVQHWQVVSDKWGYVKQLGPEGPLEYVADLNGTYSDPEDMRKALEGEIIFPKKRTPPTLEKAIIMAFTFDDQGEL
jgi:hypothetical protein